MKKWFAVLGNPISHSLSPFMHDTWLRDQNIDASYLPILVEEDRLAEAVEALKLLGCSGWNVTVPYKTSILPLLDEIDVSASGIGAVNTVVKTEDGKLIGYNTDGLGFIRSLGSIKPSSNILLIGAGGAARGIAHAFKQSGYSSLTIANRTLENAEKIIADIGVGQAISLPKAEEQVGQYDIIVQTTSLGLASNQKLPIRLKGVKQDAIVADIVYNPLVTPFLEEANKYNVQTVNGLGMLVHQGALAFSYWNREYPETDRMIQRLTELLGGNYVNR